MNIFILDLDINKCVEYYVDKHIIKIVLEVAQMLSTTVRLTGIDAGYKITHQNHPCTKWARESLSNWLWLKNLAKHLNNEWQYRYNHTYNCKAYDVILSLPEPELPDIGLTPFVICMNDEYRINNDAVKSYRNYYIKAKSHIFSWKNREIPKWLDK